MQKLFERPNENGRAAESRAKEQGIIADCREPTGGAPESEQADGNAVKYRIELALMLMRHMLLRTIV